MADQNFFEKLWADLSARLSLGGESSNGTEKLVQEKARSSAVVVWLIGKTGAGKTSIISTWTGDSRAEIGLGIAPCTRTSQVYDFPPEAPVIRFLDTRGIGEIGYDPTDDMTWCEGQSHLLMIVMQVADQAQSEVTRIVMDVRKRHPDWPVIVAQTGLHRRYPSGQSHSIPYPYDQSPTTGTAPSPPHAVLQALAHQRKLFEGLPGPAPQFVAIDFTEPSDGYPPLDYGIEMLHEALTVAGLEAIAAVRSNEAAQGAALIHQRARPLIWGYAAAALSAGAVPVPYLGVSGLAGSLALMLKALGDRYGVSWTTERLSKFRAAVGVGAFAVALRYGIQELIKVIPGIGTWIGGALNASASFALTVGIGEAACVWLSYEARGKSAPPDEVRRAFTDGLAAGLKSRNSGRA